MTELPIHDLREGVPRELHAPHPDDGPSLADLFAPPKPPPAPGAPAGSGTSGGGAGGVEDPEIRARVEKAIDELRPYINADGGDIVLHSVIDGVVRVSLNGACSSCSASLYTLQLGVERKLREEIPGIKYVEAV